MTSLRPYQSRAVDFLAANSRALCICPAGGGKTIIGAAALARAKGPNSRIGWACNTREQVDQGKAALAAAGVVPEWVKCVAGIDLEDVAGIDLLVIDETHHLIAASWLAVAMGCQGTIWGLTATPTTGSEERDALFFAFWQGKTITVSRAEVMAGGHLASGSVVVLDVDSQGEFDAAIESAAKIEADKLIRRFRFLNPDELKRRAIWQATLSAVIANTNRESAAVAVAVDEIANDKSVLVLVAQIDQGNQLTAKIPGAFFVHGKLSIKARRAAIQGFRDGSLRCMVATSLADEGMDVPRASVLILATVGRSAAKVEQRSGRVMRPHESKEFGVVYDFADRGAKMAYYQHLARLKTYKALGYSIHSNN